MTPWLDDGDVRLYHGDALVRLQEMPSESVQCIVTSPPFWGLRDYGEAGQIGLEETPDEWCAKLVAVMREARRVLRSDGVCWIEVGDTYCSTAPGTRNTPDFFAGEGAEARGNMRPDTPPNCKPKDLVGAPWLLAFALRADGWFLRSDTIWARPNPMPESVTDRPTKAHSYVFLLSKSARYFYDADAIREEAAPASEARYAYAFGGPKARALLEANKTGVGVGTRTIGEREPHPGGRNSRSVWTIATEATPFAHFATFPQALVERCIKAGTSEHGACSECGAPWRRVTERDVDEKRRNGHRDRHDERRQFDSHIVTATTTGWEPTCGSWRPGPPPPVKPCVVLDPFMGSGTTALVARRLGRHAIGIELNESYLTISATRLQQLSLLGGIA